MLTCRVAFAAGDNITVLKLIEKGFPKESLAMLVVVMFPFGQQTQRSMHK